MKKMIAALCLIASSAHAYSLYDGRPHWRQDIQYYCEDRYRYEAMTAMHQWQAVLGNTIHFVEAADPLDANLVILTVNPSSDNTYTAYSSFQVYNDESIAFGCISVFIPQYFTEGVLLHELGHVLGLEHSSDPAAIMFPTVEVWKSDLGVDDINAICDLYDISVIEEIPVSVKWVRGHLFHIDSFTGAIVTYGKASKFVIDHRSDQKLAGPFPVKMTITYDGVQKEFLVVKPLKRKPETLSYDY